MQHQTDTVSSYAVNAAKRLAAQRSDKSLESWWKSKKELKMKANIGLAFVRLPETRQNMNSDFM